MQLFRKNEPQKLEIRRWVRSLAEMEGFEAFRDRLDLEGAAGLVALYGHECRARAMRPEFKEPRDVETAIAYEAFGWCGEQKEAARA